MRYCSGSMPLDDGGRVTWSHSWRAATRGARIRAAAWVALAIAAVVWAALHAWVSDDSFITFRYCDNLLAGHGPVYNPGERSEGYTHFLWFLVLSLGRALDVPAPILGRYTALPFYALALFLLLRLSARLFPGRGGVWGIPVAALGWAMHEDARLFASGGLETAAFICALLAGFLWTAVSEHPRRGALAGWALAVAWLLRPDALLHAVLAAGYLAAGGRAQRPALRDFVVVWGLLVIPHFAFRMLYYGYPFPNPYYAKSGSLAHWSQGWLYFATYFEAYFVLGLSVVGMGLVAAALLRRHATHTAARPLALAAVASLATIGLVTRAGGDFMFARFFLPVTPYLLLLCEAAVQRIPRASLRWVAGLAVVALVAVGVVRKHAVFHHQRTVEGIVDEPQFYPKARLREIQELSRPLRDCLQGTQAAILVAGGQASLAYYARFPIAIERHGLTDETIAHSKIAVRGRPGHEKFATWEYLVQRRVALRVNYLPVRNVPLYTMFELPGVSGEIVVYDRSFMEHFKHCAGANFIDFPVWLANDYIPNVARLSQRRQIVDWNDFQRFYFDHNPDPENLRGRLRDALAAQGLTDIPVLPTVPRLFDTFNAPQADR